MVFLHKEGSCGRPRGSRFVWVILCMWATLGMRKVYLLPTFDRDIDVQSFDIIILIPNRSNEKTSREQKIGLILILNNHFSDHY